MRFACARSAKGPENSPKKAKSDANAVRGAFCDPAGHHLPFISDPPYSWGGRKTAAFAFRQAPDDDMNAALNGLTARNRSLSTRSRACSIPNIRGFSKIGGSSVSGLQHRRRGNMRRMMSITAAVALTASAAFVQRASGSGALPQPAGRRSRRQRSADRKGPILLGRPELLLVSQRLERPRLVLVRLRLRLRLWLGRRLGLARLGRARRGWHGGYWRPRLAWRLSRLAWRRHLPWRRYPGYRGGGLPRRRP